MYEKSGIIVAYIVGGDCSTMRAQFKWIWKEYEQSDPAFIYPRYIGLSSKFYRRRLPLEIPETI